MRLDRELDHLCTLGLIQGGLSSAETDQTDETGAPIGPPPASIEPTSLALHMYARCHGAHDPLAFHGLT